jgi:[ribosomal protein S5]-alanine N-acetyltransferase
VIILETPRLLLRRFIPEDVNALFALYCDPEIRQYFPDGTLSFDDTKKELEWFLQGHPSHPELGLWATIHKDSSSFIGRCGLLPWTIDEVQEIEIAYLLGKSYWGQGLATEAAQAIKDYAFSTLQLSRLICLIDPENDASKKVAQRIGMTLEKEVDGIDGDGIPTLIYSVNKAE